VPSPTPTLKTSTGVWLGEDRVVVTSLAKTPFGMRQTSTTEVPILDGDLAGTLAGLVERGQLKGKVVCGFDVRRSVTMTRRVGPDEEGDSPAELLAARLGYIEGGLAAGMRSVKLPSGPHALLVACPRRLASHVMVGLEGLRISQVRLAPLTPALSLLAQRHKKSSRKSRAEVRVLLGDNMGMAILAYAGRPVASRLFDAEPSDLSHAVEIAVLSLVTYAREELGIGQVDGLILHVDEEQYPALAETVGVECDLTAHYAPPLAVDGHSASYALAVAGISDKSNAVDLLQGLHPPAGFRKNFPARSVALLLLVLAGAWWSSHRKISRLDVEAARYVKKTESLAKTADVRMSDLKKLHERLALEVSHAEAFLADRVFWSDLLRELPVVLPETAELLDFDGRDKINFPRKKKAAATTKGRQLSMTTVVGMDEETVSPPEVAQITDALRASEVYRNSFPRITGANLRITPGKKGVFANIRLLLLPQAAP
jgi:hypothetical protein